MNQDQDETNDLTLWPVFRLATYEFLRRVDKFYTVNKGKGALMLMRDDKLACYALGVNKGLLGVGHQANVLDKPAEVVELRGKTVVQFSNDLEQMMALTSDGDLYGWGWNSCGEVGCGNQVPQLRPVLVMRRVKMVTCGYRNTMALDQDGSLWFWGKHFYKSARRIKIFPLPVKTFLELEGSQSVEQIGLNDDYCVILTNQGRLYYQRRWEKNWVELEIPVRIKLEMNKNSPSVSLSSTIIGFAFFPSDILVLTASGQIRSCGFKFPLFNLLQLDEPVKAMTRDGCFKLQSGRVAIYTSSGGLSFTIRRTSLTSIADAGALYGRWPETPGITILPPNIVTSDLMQSLRHFNNPFDYDLKVRMDKAIRLKKEVAVKCGSTWLAAKIKDTWKYQSEVDLRYYDYEFVVWLNFLRFVHTRTVGVIEPWWACELLTLANESSNGELHDLILHLVTNHMTNGAETLVNSPDWPLVLEQLPNSLTIANSVSYLQLAEEIGDRNLQNRIWRLFEEKTLFAVQKARDVLKGLKRNHSTAFDLSC